MKKFLQMMLLAALLVPIGARAQNTLTVANGTETNDYVPFYGLYTDADQHNQMIYPASMLASLAGDSLKSIEFYMSSTASSSWNTTVTVSLAEITQTTLNGLSSVTVTPVWTGVVSGQDDTLHFDFSQGFAYHGGNLLVDITTIAATYSSASFYGIASTSSSILTYDYYGSTTSNIQNFLPKATFTTVQGAFGVCPPPADLVVTAQPTQTTLTWTGTAASYELTLGDSIIGAVTSPYTITDLTPGQNYTANLIAVCTSGDSSFAVSISFFTPCVDFPAPFTEGFESNNHLACATLTQVYNSYGSIYPTISTVHHSGSSSYYFYYGNLVAMPRVDLAANEMHVSFWALNSSTGVMEAGYMTDPNVDSTFVPIVTVRANENEWQEYEFYTDSLPATDTVYIAFRHSTYYSTYIDDIVIEQSSECRRPSVSNIDSTSATSAWLSWSPNGIGTTYEVGYATENDNEMATIIPDVADTSLTITGLNPNTMYWFWVRTLCGDEPTAWHYIGHARTACGAMIAPVIEDFSLQTAYDMPSCWTATEIFFSGSMYPYTNSSGYLYFYPHYQQNNVAAMPLINLPVNEMSVIVRAHAYSSSAYRATLEFGYVTSLDSGATFYPLATITPTSTSYSTPNEFEFTTASVPTTLDTIYLAFRASTTNDYGYAYLDAVEVRHLSNCTRPIAMQVSNVTHETATLTWDAVSVADGYVVRYATSNNVNHPSAVEEEATDTTLTLTSLNASTHYYTWVRTTCADENSDWRQGPEFTTTCGENPCFITIDMADSFGDGWNGNGINFIVNGNMIATATLTTGNAGTFTQAICEEDTIQLIWQSGSYAYETSFSIDYAGTLVIDDASGDNYSTGEILLSAIGCPTCAAPNNIVATDIDSTSISVSWTPAGEFDDNWAVYLNGTFVAAVSTPSYTFTGLTANTPYAVGIATICTDDTTSPAVLNTRTECLSGSCALTVEMADSYGDGWNGGGFIVMTETDTLAVSLYDGDEGIEVVPVCNGENMIITFASGYYPGEMSFSLTFADGRSLAHNASGSAYNDGDTLFNAAAECRSCASPTELTLTNATATTATLTWNAGEATSWRVSIADTTGIINSTVVTTATHTFTGLANSSIYTVSVTALCSAEDSSWTTTMLISTPCPGVALPWHDDISNYDMSTGALTCWSTPTISTYSGYTYPRVLGDGRYSILAASLEGDTMGTAIAATPMLLGPANNLYVRFKGFSAIDGDADTAFFEAGIMTDVYNPSTFVPLFQIGNTNGDDQEFEFLTNTLTNTANGWVAFRTTILNGEDDEALCAFVLKDIYVQTIPNCQRPDSVGVTFNTNMTNVDVVLTWPTVTGSTGYTVEIVNDTTYTTTTNTLTLPALPGNTAYTVRVYNNCSATDRSLPRSVSFTTPCTGFPLPYSEGFENFTSAYPECWTRPVQYPDYSGNLSPYISTSYSHGGNNSLYYRATSSISTMAISPVLYGQANNVNVSFWVYGSSSAGFIAGIMTDPNDMSTFIPMLTVPSTSYTWTRYEFNTDTLTLTDSTFHFALRATSTYTSAYNIYLDDITVATIPPCAENFASVKVDRIGGDSAWVSFETGLGRNESSTFTITVMNDAGATIGSYTSNNSPVEIVNLQPSNSYSVIVSLNCGGTVTATSDPVSFITRCAGSNTVEIGTSTSAGVYYPVYPYYNHSVTQSIYPDSLLGDATTFESLSVNCSTANGTLTGFRGRIWLKEVDDTITSVDAWIPLDSMTLVYDGDLPLQNGWVEFFFQTPFAYSGNGNLIVCMMADTTFGTYQSGYNFYRHNGPTGTTRYYYSDGSAWENWMTTSVSGYTSSSRADIRFSSCGSQFCETPAFVDTIINELDITVAFTNTAASYEVAIVEGAWEAPTNATIISDTVYTFNDLTAETQYTLGVRAICGSGLYSEWATMTVTTAEHPCAVPTDLAANNVSFSSAVLDWTVGETETSWEINVTGTNYDETFTVTTKPYTVTGLANGVTYTAKVRAICREDRYSDWSETTTFTTTTCQSVSNVQVSNITTNSATVTWNAPDNAETFEVNYGQSGFTQGSGTIVTANGGSYTITGLTASMVYDVYVRTVCELGVYSDWSTVKSFETSNNAIDDVDNSLISLYPNPASSTVTLTGIEGTATVTVVDMNGRETGKWTVNNGELTIDVTEMAQGAYFVRIVGEKVNAIRKLIVR